MLVMWQMEIEQLQVTAFSEPLTGFGSAHPDSPEQGSTLKFQSFFPSVFPMSLRASTAETNHNPT